MWLNVPNDCNSSDIVSIVVDKQMYTSHAPFLRQT